jgi:transposase
VLTSGCAWRDLPPSFGVPSRPRTAASASGPKPGCGDSGTTRSWTSSAAGASSTGSRAIVDGACVRVKKGIHDRSQPGVPRQARLEDPCPVRPRRAAARSRGLRCQHSRLARPQTAGDGDPRGPRRRKPAKLHADKAYDQPDLRCWVRDRGIKVRIARKGIESKDKLGKHRWVIERTMCLVHRIPPPHVALRTQSRTLPRLPHPRSQPHLLQETPQTHNMRQALSRLAHDCGQLACRRNVPGGCGRLDVNDARPADRA